MYGVQTRFLHQESGIVRNRLNNETFSFGKDEQDLITCGNYLSSIGNGTDVSTASLQAIRGLETTQRTSLGYTIGSALSGSTKGPSHEYARREQLHSAGPIGRDESGVFH
jgi:hypothetical protein